MASKLRILHLDRQYISTAIKHVLACQFYPAWQQIAELTELAHRIQQALA
ncbi:Uncharacterised protein [Vibrio cholerae]|nr:Uncharacterised protein [Vibrio cholerae]